MKSGVSMTKNKLKIIVSRMRTMTGRTVLVGIPSDKAMRQGGAPTNAMLGYIHEFGAPEANIPARPFLLPGIRAVKDKVAGYLKQSSIAALKGDSGKADRAMGAAGLVAVSSIQRQFTSGSFAPLKPSTLKARRRRGRTGTRPLIDTGQLRRSITFVLRTGKIQALKA